MPLRNRGGFALPWHWTYDAVKKLVLAGPADRVMFNTTPMSRLEMARIVAQAIDRVTGDEGGRMRTAATRGAGYDKEEVIVPSVAPRIRR